MLYLVVALAAPVLLLGAILALERYEQVVLQPGTAPSLLPAAPLAAPESAESAELPALPEMPAPRTPASPVLRPLGDAPRPLSVAGLDLAG